MEKKLENFLKEYSPGDELEIRIGFFKNGKFISRITSFMFETIKNELSKSFNVDRVQQTLYTQSTHNIRLKTIVTGDEQVTIKKTVKNTMDLYKLGLRLSLSKEEIVEPLDKNTRQNIKKRDRLTFYKDINTYHIDLTTDEIDGIKYHQLELEYTSSATVDNKNFLKILYWFSDIRKKLFEDQAIVKEFNSYFFYDINYKKSKDKDIPFEGGTMPKTLHQHLVPFLYDYVILSKPNGVTYNLFFSGKFGMVYINKTEIIRLGPVIHKNLIGTIIIGEYIHGLYYAFDFLFYKYVDIRKKQLTDRHNLLNSIKNTLTWNNFRILPIFYTKNLHKDLIDCFEYIHQTWKFEDNDGIILKPQYLPMNNKYVYKWKPLVHITIDLWVKKLGDITYAYTYGYNDEPVLFQGTQKFPYSGEVDMGDIKVPDFTIVEFNSEIDKNKITLHANRIRNDKVKPNFITVAQKTWVSINDPFTEDILLKLSQNVITFEENLVNVSQKVCKYLHITKDPLIFNELGDYINNNIVTDIYKEGVNLAHEKSIGNNLVPILYEYFK